MTVTLGQARAVEPPSRRRSQVPALIRRHPLALMLGWFFTVGQAIAFVPVLGATRGADLPAAPFVVASTIFGLLLPTLVLTWMLDGPRALVALGRRAVAMRVGAGWYLFALVLVPAVAVAIAGAIFGMPAGGPASTMASAALLGLVAQTAVGLVTSNLAEEVAWMGFVQARLQDRRGPMAAAVLTAPLFALQHLSLLVHNAGFAAPVLLGLLVVMAVPFRALLGWVHNRTNSLFAVGLVHAAGNAVAAGAGLGGAGLLPRLYPDVTVGPLHIAAFAALGMVVLVATRGRLGHPSWPGHPVNDASTCH